MIDAQKGIVLAVNDLTNLAIAVTAPDSNTTPTDVQDGSTINGIYLNVECYATTAAALANVYLIIIKNPAGTLGVIAPNTVGTNTNKRFVIHQEMKMLEQSVNGNPRTVFNGVIVIPKGYRRFAHDDKLQMRVLAPGVNISLCLQCHYKEFR